MHNVNTAIVVITAWADHAEQLRDQRQNAAAAAGPGHRQEILRAMAHEEDIRARAYRDALRAFVEALHEDQMLDIPEVPA
ncbi:MAG: hypothetical protein HGA65_03465 [Oscillochloris sp.]|nr:hypothetical protein [Oscillochloris sp.]